MRSKLSSDRMTINAVAAHWGQIAELSWTPFRKSTRLKNPLESFQAEIQLLYGLLTAKKREMTSTTPSIFANAKRSAIPSAFVSVAGAVSIVHW